MLCRDRSCTDAQEAVAVTKDGFANTNYLRVRYLSDLQWVSQDTFVAVQPSGDVTLVSPSAPVRLVTTSTVASPLRSGERLLFVYGPPPGQYQYLGVDGDAATAHPLSTPFPQGKSAQLVQQGTDTVWGTQDASRIITSTDGGATWHHATNSGRLQVDPISSGAPTVLAGILAGDDDSRQADNLVRSTDGGVTWQPVHPGDLAEDGASWAVVEPDGQLLIQISDFHGTRSPQAGSPQAGLFESDSTAWQAFHRVPVTGLAGVESDDGQLLATAVDESGRQSLFLQTAKGLTLSTDGGRTWTTTPAR